MREINLHVTTTYTATIDTRNVKPDQLVDLGGGRTALSFGTFFSEEYAEVVKVARRNGGQVLYAATSIEQSIENILLNYFMGPFTPMNSPRQLFEVEVLQSSALTYRAKKDLLSKVINESGALSGKRKNKLQSHLKKVMEWRNAFAHGKIQHDATKGCVVRYYSGDSKQLTLSENTLDEIEHTFKECRTLLNLVLSRIIGDGK
ncbi:hypothetical protein [Spongiibacter tropicus]|uniref:hypothetical protein n=1 Tax=Spongiibacter tropicus TaxID=454602 RepID=UPI003A998F2F